ncbi:hypothetical protein PR048_006634 [Dryococelus australis]|uniref:Uncharacterized protein n=1 Tax=Dryococelus australis TaxID=614101 RepID=A0ABQ9ICR1_9NEOP|nr:hypothetical protein PR048_006634 [Dryococelus australis]
MARLAEVALRLASARSLATLAEAGRSTYIIDAAKAIGCIEDFFLRIKGVFGKGRRFLHTTPASTNFTGRMPLSAPVKTYARRSSDFFLRLKFESAHFIASSLQKRGKGKTEPIAAPQGSAVLERGCQLVFKRRVGRRCCTSHSAGELLVPSARELALLPPVFRATTLVSRSPACLPACVIRLRYLYWLATDKSTEHCLEHCLRLDSAVLCTLKPQVFVHWLTPQKVANVTSHLAVWQSLLSLQVCYWFRVAQCVSNELRYNCKTDFSVYANNTEVGTFGESTPRQAPDLVGNGPTHAPCSVIPSANCWEKHTSSRLQHHFHERLPRQSKRDSKTGGVNPNHDMAHRAPSLLPKSVIKYRWNEGTGSQETRQTAFDLANSMRKSLSLKDEYRFAASVGREVPGLLYIPETTLFFYLLLHRCEDTPFLTELCVIGAHNFEVFIYWYTVTQGVSGKVWFNDKLIGKSVPDLVQTISACRTTHSRQLFLLLSLSHARSLLNNRHVYDLLNCLAFGSKHLLALFHLNVWTTARRGFQQITVLYTKLAKRKSVTKACAVSPRKAAPLHRSTANGKPNAFHCELPCKITDGSTVYARGGLRQNIALKAVHDKRGDASRRSIVLRVSRKQHDAPTAHTNAAGRHGSWFNDTHLRSIKSELLDLGNVFGISFNHVTKIHASHPCWDSWLKASLPCNSSPFATDMKLQTNGKAVETAFASDWLLNSEKDSCWQGRRLAICLQALNGERRPVISLASRGHSAGMRGCSSQQAQPKRPEELVNSLTCRLESTVLCTIVQISLHIGCLLSQRKAIIGPTFCCMFIIGSPFNTRSQLPSWNSRISQVSSTAVSLMHRLVFFDKGEEPPGGGARRPAWESQPKRPRATPVLGAAGGKCALEGSTPASLLKNFFQAHLPRPLEPPSETPPHCFLDHCQQATARYNPFAPVENVADVTNGWLRSLRALLAPPSRHCFAYSRPPQVTGAAWECRGGVNGSTQRKPAGKRHDSHMRKSGSESPGIEPTGDRNRIAMVGGERPNHCATAAPSRIIIKATLAFWFVFYVTAGWVEMRGNTDDQLDGPMPSREGRSLLVGRAVSGGKPAWLDVDPLVNSWPLPSRAWDDPRLQKNTRAPAPVDAPLITRTIIAVSVRDRARLHIWAAANGGMTPARVYTVLYCEFLLDDEKQREFRRALLTVLFLRQPFRMQDVRDIPKRVKKCCRNKPRTTAVVKLQERERTRRRLQTYELTASRACDCGFQTAGVRVNSITCMRLWLPNSRPECGLPAPGRASANGKFTNNFFEWLECHRGSICLRRMDCSPRTADTSLADVMTRHSDAEPDSKFGVELIIQPRSIQTPYLHSRIPATHASKMASQTQQHVGMPFANNRLVTYLPPSIPTNRTPFATRGSQSDTRPIRRALRSQLRMRNHNAIPPLCLHLIYGRRRANIREQRQSRTSLASGALSCPAGQATGRVCQCHRVDLNACVKRALAAMRRHAQIACSREVMNVIVLYILGLASFLHWLLHRCEATPFLTELHVTGAHYCEVIIYWCRVTQRVSGKGERGYSRECPPITDIVRYDYRNPGVVLAGIEPGSSWWKAV